MSAVASFRREIDIRRATAVRVRPPRRVRPSQAAAEVLRTDKGAWDPTLTPYLVEPLDQIANRTYRGVVFCGPARTGKTMGLVLGGIAYVVTCAPGDVLVVQMSQDTARDFSRLDLDRAIRHSPALAEALSPRARDDNTYDKFWRSGTVLKLGWPAVSQLSGKTFQYVFITDHDRPENTHNVDGEGPMFELAAKRTETYMSRGKVIAESSPGEDCFDAGWVRRGHEAPPVRGILQRYNEGTRARWYWPCLGCGEYFEAAPGLEPFALLPPCDDLQSIVKGADLAALSVEFARVVCMSCGFVHRNDNKPQMNARGRWLHEGERLEDGEIVGERRDAPYASYYLGGVAASYMTWEAMILGYLQAVAAYVQTGDESPLRRVYTTDFAAPYVPRVSYDQRGAEHLARRTEPIERGSVPGGVRFLTAAVDVQSRRFRVDVVGWGVGLEAWIIDRYDITASNRREGDRYAGIDPASYLEDWDVLVAQVLDREYRRGDEIFRPVLVLCDSGGQDGVTEKAYDFWRSLKKRQKHQRFALVKGVGNVNAPRVQRVYPDARGRKAGVGRGDVPVWMLNVNLLKDGVWGCLHRDDPGPGYIHLPDWLPEEFFHELSAEQRTPKGWVRRKSKLANEDFDLLAYNRAGCIILGAETIDWSNAPAWTRPRTHDVRPEPERAQQAQQRRDVVAPRRNWVKDW